MAQAQKDLENYLKQIEQLDKIKQEIIEKLLAERAQIDAQLEKLGYRAGTHSAHKGGRPKGKKDSHKRAGKASVGGEVSGG